MPSVINTPFDNEARTKLGVKPTGVPLYYQPSLVAAAILYAVEHPTRDVIVDDVGRAIDFLQKMAPHLAPHLVDTLVGAIAVPGQRTNTIKSVDDPNNLFEPIEGYANSNLKAPTATRSSSISKVAASKLFSNPVKLVHKYTNEGKGSTQVLYYGLLNPLRISCS